MSAETDQRIDELEGRVLTAERRHKQLALVVVIYVGLIGGIGFFLLITEVSAWWVLIVPPLWVLMSWADRFGERRP